MKNIELGDVTGLFFQLPSMHTNYERYPELVFIDCSIKQKNKAKETELDYTFGLENDDQLHLVVLSGLNSEGENIIFGCAILQNINFESLCWVFHHFKQANITRIESHETVLTSDTTEEVNKEGFADPEAIITTYTESISGAIEFSFSHRTTHLFCQNSIKEYLKDQMSFLLEKNEGSKRVSNLKDLHDLIIDLVDESEQERFCSLQETIFQLGVDLIEIDKIQMLRQLLSIKEKWSSAFWPLKFTCGTHNMNRALKISKLLNSKLYGRSNMLELFKLIEDSDQ